MVMRAMNQLTWNYSWRVGADIMKLVSNTEGEISDDDEQEDGLPELYVHSNLQKEYSLNKQAWQEIIECAHSHSRKKAQAYKEEDGNRGEDLILRTNSGKLGARYEVSCNYLRQWN